MLHLFVFHLAAVVPGGSPSAPQGLSGPLSNLINSGKWIATGAGLAGGLYNGGKLAHAHQSGGFAGGHYAGLWMLAARVGELVRDRIDEIESDRASHQWRSAPSSFLR